MTTTAIDYAYVDLHRRGIVRGDGEVMRVFTYPEGVETYRAHGRFFRRVADDTVTPVPDTWVPCRLAAGK